MSLVTTDSQARQSHLDLLQAVLDLWQTLARDPFDSYRPERHYMRGRGPKAREKLTHGVSGLSFNVASATSFGDDEHLTNRILLVPSLCRLDDVTLAPLYSLRRVKPARAHGQSSSPQRELSMNWTSSVNSYLRRSTKPARLET
jgi:hypothetical protein